MQFKLRAANQNGEAVTEVLFWDGPERGIATYKYEVEKEFENCVCCFTNPIPKVGTSEMTFNVMKHTK